MGSLRMSPVMMLVVVTMLVVSTRVAEGQSPAVPSCASKLIPCADYLKSTKPPPSCCDPLRDAVTNELDCLCNLYENPEFLKSLGINITQALALPRYCNISGDLSACKAPAPGSSASTPPAAPGKDSSGAGRNAWTGLSSLLMVGPSLMLF